MELITTNTDGSIEENGSGSITGDSKPAGVNATIVPNLCSQRWILGYLGFAFGIVLSIYRIDMSIAIVCMTGDTTNTTEFHDQQQTVINIINGTFEYNNKDGSVHIDDNSVPIKRFKDKNNNTSIGMINVEECEEVLQRQEADSTMVGEFTWDKKTQSIILSAFFYGFVVSQIPGGYLTGRFGGKMVATVCFTISSVMTLLIPVLTRAHVYGAAIARILIGLASGPLPPAWFALVGRWALPNERSSLAMFFWFGQAVGAMLGYTTSGYLCAYGFDNGWGSIFYTHGAIGIIYVLMWMYYVSDSPNSHPRITEAERTLLQQGAPSRTNVHEKVVNIPWCKVFTSVPVWSIYITHACDNWMYYLVLSCLPMFVKEILRFDIQSNGFYSSLPFITSIFSMVPAGIAADFLNKKRWLSRTTIRKIFQITSLLGSAVFLVLSGYIPCDERAVVILCICLSQFFLNMACTAAYPCNLIDMTPRYAPFLYSVSNTLGASTGFLAPLAVGWLTQGKTLGEWRNVFWLSAGISIFGAIVYSVFSTSEPCDWDKDHHKTIELKVVSDAKNISESDHLKQV